MAVIEAVATDLALDLLAQLLVGDVSTVQFSYFELGEGGFIESGAVKSPKTPDPAKTRIDAVGIAITGGVQFTNGSDQIDGSGTAFLSEISAGQYIMLDDDLLWSQVLSVEDDTNLTLAAVYAGAGSVSFLPSSVSSEQLYVFRKSFVGTDLTFEEAGRAVATAFLDFAEGNVPAWLIEDPEYFEIGLFDNAGNMIAYGTFPGETKTNLIEFNKIVRTTFSRA